MNDVTGERAAREPIRIGMVGAGTIAQIAELPALAANPAARIVGLVTPSRAETDANLRRWPIDAGYRSAEEMLDRAEVDALVVVTPKNNHTEYVKLALERDVDVFCEKPLASSLREAEELAELEEQSAGLLMVGFNRRYAEVYVHAKKRFDDCRLEFVVAQKNRVGTEYRATLENGIHIVDLLRWFCGEPTSVTATSRYSDPYREDGVAALIEFDSGIAATLAILRSAGEWDERLELYGGHQTVRVVAPDEVTSIQDGTRSVIDLGARANGWNDVNRAAGFAGAIDHFLACVASRETPLTNGLEAVKSQRFMDLILESAGLPTTDAPKGR